MKTIRTILIVQGICLILIPLYAIAIPSGRTHKYEEAVKSEVLKYYDEALEFSNDQKITKSSRNLIEQNINNLISHQQFREGGIIVIQLTCIIIAFLCFFEASRLQKLFIQNK